MPSKRVLWTIIVVVVVGLGVFLAVRSYLNPARRAMWDLRQAGVELFHPASVSMDWKTVNRAAIPEPLSRLDGVDRLHIFNAENDIVPVLQAVRSSKRLEVIWLTKVTLDSSTSQLLAEFGTITVLRLESSKCKDWSFLRGLKRLEMLNFPNSDFSDDGAAILPKLPRLRDVNVGYSGVTDVAVPHFIACKNLTYLDIDRTYITTAGYERLKAARPDLKIEFSVSSQVPNERPSP